MNLERFLRAFAPVVVALLAAPPASGPASAADEWEQTLRAGEEAFAAKEYQRAEELLGTAADQASAFAPDDARRVAVLMRLASVYRAQGDLAKPEELYRQASPIALAAHGSDSVEYARFLNEVGRYYHSRRKYERAEQLYRDAFGIRVRALGQEHAEVADSINNLAVLYENQMRYDKAQMYYRTALEIREKLLGKDHVKTVETLEHFSRLLVKMQQAEEASRHAAAAEIGRRKLLEAASKPPVAVTPLVTRAGPNIEPPRLETKTEPRYTEEARIARHEGVVTLQMDIDAEGAPRNIRVVRLLGLGLDEQAIEAARQWRFKPARRDRKKVGFRATLEMSFRLL